VVKPERGHSNYFFSKIKEEKLTDNLAIHLLPMRVETSSTRDIYYDVKKTEKENNDNKIVNRFTYYKKYVNKLQQNIGRNY